MVIAIRFPFIVNVTAVIAKQCYNTDSVTSECKNQTWELYILRSMNSYFSNMLPDVTPKIIFCLNESSKTTLDSIEIPFRKLPSKYKLYVMSSNTIREVFSRGPIRAKRSYLSYNKHTLLFTIIRC